MKLGMDWEKISTGKKTGNCISLKNTHLKKVSQFPNFPSFFRLFPVSIFFSSLHIQKSKLYNNYFKIEHFVFHIFDVRPIVFLLGKLGNWETWCNSLNFNDLFFPEFFPVRFFPSPFFSQSVFFQFSIEENPNAHRTHKILRNYQTGRKAAPDWHASHSLTGNWFEYQRHHCL